IIDEVHMLTPEAFNALLKTLEEPPKHIIFVLATTELQKVPLTIASRCQRLDFGRLKIKEIKDHLLKIAKAEEFEIEEKALELIARSAEGAMRDAVSLLDQLVSFAGHKIKYDDVVTLLGTVEEDLLFGFAETLAKGDTNKILELTRQALEEGRSMLQVTRDLVFHFRNLLHIKVGSGEALEVTSDYLNRLEEQAKKFSLERIKRIIQVLSRAELDMRWHPHARLVLEVALLELLEAQNSEVRVETHFKAAEATTSSPDLTAENKATEPLITKVKEHWKAILDSMRKKSIYGYVSLQEGEPLEINERGKLVIAFRKGYTFHKERLEEAKNQQALEESIREVLGQRIPVECIVKDGNTLRQTISAQMVAEFFGGRVLS
ncbi:MAG: DNA polymerase III subunit delta, partial [Candidatus Margulisiibacteriota bacterium]